MEYTIELEEALKDTFETAEELALRVQMEPLVADWKASQIEPAEIDLDGVTNFERRVYMWVTMTGEYGRPSPEYIEDFIKTFYRMCGSENGLTGTNQEVWDAQFIERAMFTGGYKFWMILNDFKPNNEEELREFLNDDLLV